jgi:hypothetical protein
MDGPVVPVPRRMRSTNPRIGERFGRARHPPDQNPGLQGRALARPFAGAMKFSGSSVKTRQLEQSAGDNLNNSKEVQEGFGEHDYLTPSLLRFYGIQYGARYHSEAFFNQPDQSSTLAQAHARFAPYLPKDIDIFFSRRLA